MSVQRGLSVLRTIEREVQIETLRDLKEHLRVSGGDTPPGIGWLTHVTRVIDAEIARLETPPRGRWEHLENGEILEMVVNLRSADEAVDFQRNERLLGELLAEARRRALEVPDA